MIEFINITATIESFTIIAMTSPFICTFELRYQNDVFTAALMGNKGRTLYTDIQPGQKAKVIGYFTENQWTNKRVFIINTIELLEEAF